MKKTTMIICLCVIVAAFAFMFIFSVCLPRTTVSSYSILNEWPEFSTESLFSGQYFKGITSYFTDTINSRDKLIDIEALIRSLYGLPEEQTVINIYEDDDEEVSQNDNDHEDSLAPESTFVPDEFDASEVVPPSDTSGSQEEEKKKPELSNDILILGTRAMEIYYGNKGGKLTERYADTLNEFADKLDDSVRVYSMVIPKSSAYYLEQAKGYENLALRNKTDIDAIASHLSDRVTDVNIYNILGQHAGEEIYARTDHHWTALGAYYASSVFADNAGVAFDDISEFDEVRKSGYVGTYYSYSNNNPILKNNPEDFLIFYPDADYTATYHSRENLNTKGKDHEEGFFWARGDDRVSDWYSTFIDGDSYSVKAVSNECKNGRKLLIIKDSYGNALAPFLIEGFEEIYIVDARFYKNSLVEDVNTFGITDVLFAQCTFSAVGNDYLNSLKEICS